MRSLIVFDIDGVLCDLMGRLLLAFHEHWPDAVLERPTAWAMADAYPDLTPAQQQWWVAAFANPYYYATAIPVPYAKEAVAGARLFHHEVLFRSARPSFMQETTRTWLEEWGFLATDAPLDAVECGVYAKTAVAGAIDDRIVFIDDSLETMLSLHAHHQFHFTDYRHWLVDAPYNQTRAPLSGIERVRGVRELPLRFGNLWAEDHPAEMRGPFIEVAG